MVLKWRSDASTKEAHAYGALYRLKNPAIVSLSSNFSIGITRAKAGLAARIQGYFRTTGVGGVEKITSGRFFKPFTRTQEN